MQGNKVDAITVEIVGNLLLSIAEEIGVFQQHQRAP